MERPGDDWLSDLSGKRFWFCNPLIGIVEDAHKGILRDFNGASITIFANAVKYVKANL